MSEKKALAKLKAVLKSDKSSEEKSSLIITLASLLPDEAFAVLDEGLEQASPLVKVAIMDTYYEMTGDDFHQQDLEDIVNSRSSKGDDQEQLYMAARIALGRINGSIEDNMGMWGDDQLQITAQAQMRRSASKTSPEISIIIHGTWASDGKWWKPKGDFFEYLKTDLKRADLYGKGDQFKWSGKNRNSKRKQAASQLSLWLKKHPAAKVNVFAHSHGANVAMLATHEIRIDQLVMLSPPVRSDYFAKWKNVKQAYNIQANIDPVVAIARGGQRFNLKQVKEIKLKANGHSASHDPKVWKTEKLPNLIDIGNW